MRKKAFKSKIKIAGYAHEAGKAIVIVVNKWDAVEKTKNNERLYTTNTRAFLIFRLRTNYFVSANTKQRVHQILPIVQRVSENHAMRIQSSILNEVIEDAVARNPAPADKGRRLRIYYATQVAIQPPTFVVFVNEPELMHFSYERF